MDLLNRELQRELLARLSDLYPEPAALPRAFIEMDERQLVYNVAYLEEHGLVVANWSRTMAEPAYPLTAKITAPGIDFISDDGGLTAIFGILTVKLHEDTIKSLLLRRIADTPGDAGVKAALSEKIKNLPADALGTVTTKALDAGLEKVPDFLSALQSWLGL